MNGVRHARDFYDLHDLRDIPDGLVQAHVKLYEGYVRGFNLLQEHLARHKPGTPEWAEMKRRIGFELNGLRLHEFYFDNLVPGGKPPSTSVREVFSPAWPSFDAWREEFAEMGLMRGIGWVIFYRDPVTAALSNHWIGLHEDGHPVGFTPLLVMDVWEHAYTGMERPAYIEAFFANVDWERVDHRLQGLLEAGSMQRS